MSNAFIVGDRSPPAGTRTGRYSAAAPSTSAVAPVSSPVRRQRRHRGGQRPDRQASLRLPRRDDDVREHAEGQQQDRQRYRRARQHRDAARERGRLAVPAAHRGQPAGRDDGDGNPDLIGIPARLRAGPCHEVVGQDVRMTRGTALVRAVSPRLAEGIVTHIDRTDVDVALARRQHAAYVDALAGCGWRTVDVAPADDCPDSVFVEDTVVVCDGLAVLTRPGAAARRAEVTAVESAVRGARSRPSRPIEAPGTPRRRRRAPGRPHRLRRTRWPHQRRRRPPTRRAARDRGPVGRAGAAGPACCTSSPRSPRCRTAPAGVGRPSTAECSRRCARSPRRPGAHVVPLGGERRPDRRVGAADRGPHRRPRVPPGRRRHQRVRAAGGLRDLPERAHRIVGVESGV